MTTSMAEAPLIGRGKTEEAETLTGLSGPRSTSSSVPNSVIGSAKYQKLSFMSMPFGSHPCEYGTPV